MMHQLTPQYILERYAHGATHGELDAVCLFVDISGFTPLTLTLMEHGAEGAEVLADVLVTVFEPLIETVYAYGGFIAGFAGDAFKAIFPLDTDRAPERPPEQAHKRAVDQAVSAAWRIAETLRTSPVRATRFGWFEFSGKACVALGTVGWEVWQAPDAADIETRHRAAYLFKGPGIDAAMQLDPLAERGEIVLAPEVTERLQAPFQSTLRAGVHLLTALQPRGATAVSPTGQPAEALAEVATRFYRDTLLITPIQGEFRRVTTAFVNLADALDADQAPQFIADFFRLLAQYHGFLCRIGRIGGKDNGHTFLLFWGAPTSSERDVDRALGFLLDLQAASPVSLRAGVTTDLAYAGFVGSPRREEYTCYGTYVNLAARQLVMADWGQIWLDENTAAQAGAFACAPNGTHSFKGFAQPLPSFLLAGRRDVRAESAKAGPVRGRTRELAQLTDALQPLARGRFAGVTVLLGEAGMGKSRLAAELAQTVGRTWPEPPAFHILAADDIVRESLNPFRGWLRRLFHLADQQSIDARLVHFNTAFDAFLRATPDRAAVDELERTRSFLAALVDITWEDSLYSRLEPDLRYENTLHALRALVRAVCSRQPLVLVIEDAHWLDVESREFIHSLAATGQELPLAMVMTMRPPEQAGASQTDVDPANLFPDVHPQGIVPTVIPLGPLPAEAVDALVEETLGGPATPELLRQLVRRADGNPFFTEQIALFLREQGGLHQVNGVWDLREGDAADAEAALLSGDVRAVLTARLDRLEPALKLAVQTAAVLGREFDVAILALMLDRPTPAHSLLSAGEDAGIWTRQEARYFFRHALLRDAAYDMQLRARLRRLHQSAAAAVESVYQDNLAPWYGELVHHFNRSEDTANERTYARLAGMRAAGQFANEDAARYLSRALTLTPADEHDTQRDLLRHRAEVHNIAGNREAQTADLARLLTLAETSGTAADVADALLRRAELARVLTDYAAAERHVADAGAHAPAIGDPVLLSKLFNCWGNVLWRQGKYDPARAKLAEAFQLAQRADATSELADIHYQFGCIDYYELKYDDALARFQLAHDLYDREHAPKGRSLCLSMFGAIHYQAGRYAQSAAAYAESLAISNALGWRHTSAFLYGLLGTNDLDMGAFDRARQYHEQALQLCRELGDREGEAISLDALGLAASRRGDDREAIPHFEQAEAIQRAIGDRRSLAYTLTHAGHVHLALGAMSRAATAFEEAAAIRRDLADSATLQDSKAGLALVLLSQGDIAGAHHLVQEITGWSAAHDPTTMEYPAQVYLICAQVLDAVGTPDARAQAGELRSAGCALVLARADTLDADARATFLQAIPFHAELVSAG